MSADDDVSSGLEGPGDASDQASEFDRGGGTSPVAGLRSKLFAEVSRDNPGFEKKLENFVNSEKPVSDSLSEWFGDRQASLDRRQLKAFLARDIVEIDEKISACMDNILANAVLQKLEALWRSVRWLVSPGRGAGRSKVIIRLLNASWRDISRDFTKSPDFDHSVMFQRIHNEEFGISGGSPFGLVIGAYEIQHKPSEDAPTDDVAILRDLAQVAASAFCPMVFQAAPTFFGINKMTEISRRENIEATFEQEEYIRFKSLQKMDAARFINLCAGRMLVRAAHFERSSPDPGYVHYPQSSDGYGEPLWASTAFALAHVVLRSFREYSWPAAIRGAPEREDELNVAGGAFAAPEQSFFRTDADGTAAKIPLEMALSDQQEYKLNNLGFIAPRPCQYTNYAAIYNVPSIHQASRIGNAEQSRNARMGSMTNYLLCVCRFAHYVKIIAREWIGAYKTARECQSRLQRWLNTYCIAGEEVGYAERAKYPLRKAQIAIAEVDGRPGVFACTVQLQPHFQLDYVISEFQLTTEVETTAHAA